MTLIQTKLKSIVRQIKAGQILIAQKFMNDVLLHRSVVLILEHDETGSTGIILNKPAISIKSLEIPEENGQAQYGGTYDIQRTGYILKDSWLAIRSVKIAEGIYYSENCFPGNDLKRIKSFFGFTVWNAGQLEQEINENKWWVDDFKVEELYDPKNEDLWTSKLLNSENMYGLFYEMNDPGLN